MEPFYVFIVRNDVWIYILSALGLFWFGSEFLRARRLLKRAVFGLEKERGQRIRNHALSLILVFAAIIGGVYYVNARIAPTLPASLFRPPTPTPDIFATPLSSPTPLGTQGVVAPSPTAPLVPTITLAGQAPIDATAATAEGGTPDGNVTPSPTVTPAATVTPFIGCTLDLNISDPRDGGFVSGTFSLSGTADFPDFLSYRIEANGPETNGAWASLLGRDVDRSVRDGFLGSVNLSQWGSGPYLIRLVGTNTSGSPVGYCVIQVTIDNR